MKTEIRQLAQKYAATLKQRMDARVSEMDDDDESHVLIYQAIRMQESLETLYNGVGGEYHFGDAAGNYVKDRTGVNLHGILKKLARENTSA